MSKIEQVIDLEKFKGLCWQVIKLGGITDEQKLGGILLNLEACVITPKLDESLLLNDEETDKEYQQVREAVVRLIHPNYALPNGIKHPCCIASEIIADSILNLKYPDGKPMIGVMSPDQSYPKNPYIPNGRLESIRIYTQAQNDIDSAGFKRIIGEKE